jgi:filamentous hemagglutinin
MRMAQMAVFVCALFGGVTVVSAQIVADRNAATRPVVDQSANGLPVVQIVTPNAAGVSHNRYDQFNVGTGGAILNNSSTYTQTQQAGYIAANAALVAGSARVILNEVTGASRSQLNGFIEVAGQRAEVIVANPNGISCSNCGFINTSRGTLTTGTPELAADGSLANLRVTRGDITVGSGGMNASSLDQVDLIARSVQVNGELWGKQLNVISGANLVNYANLGVQVIGGQGAQPTVGIDMAQMGGMYANRIRLVGTESGVGVRSMGNIAAQAGDIDIDSRGMVSLTGGTTATGKIAIASAGDITNSGNLYAGQTAEITTTDTIGNTGVIAARTDVTLQARDITSSNSIAAGIDASGNAAASGNLSVTAANNMDNAGGKLYAKDNLTLQTGNDLTNVNGVIHSDGNIDIAATGALNNKGGRIEAGGSAATFNLAAASIDNSDGKIANSGSGLTQVDGGAQILNARSTLATDAGVIGGNGDVKLTSLALNNGQGAQVLVGNDLALQVASLDNNGDISATRDLSVTVTNAFTSTASSSLSAVRNLALTANSIDNNGLINSGAKTVVKATTSLRNAGKIYGEDIALGALDFSNTVNTTTGLAGVVAARNSVQIGADQVTNSEHALLQSLGDMTIAGALDSNDQAIGSANSIINESATIDAGGALSLQTATLLNRNNHFSTTLQDDAALTRYVTQYANWAAPDTWYDANQVSWSDSGGGGIVLVIPDGNRFEQFYKHDYVEVVQKTVVLSSDPGRISSGGNMLLSGSVTNDKSVMIAGGTLSGAVGTINNIGATGTQTTIWHMNAGQNYYHWVSGHPHTNYYTYNNGGAAYDNVMASATLDLPVASVQQNATPTGITNPALSAGAPGAGIGIGAGALPQFTIPNNGLFAVRNQPGQNYLVETDPKFTDYKTFVSSDYMLSRMTLDPQTTQKRLGDGFYEQKLITDQVAELTGRRMLDGYASAENQYKALMDAGVASASRFQLTPGIALSDAQIAALTSDIVWLVEQDVTLPDGTTTKALAPVVYLSRASTEDIKPAGTLISGKDIDLKVSGSLDNGGTLLASNNMVVQATDINNTGSIASASATGSVALTATNDVQSSGNISGNRVGILAGRDVNLVTTTASNMTHDGLNTKIDQVSSVNAGQLAIQAGRDVNLVATAINTSGDASVITGHDLNFTTIKTQNSYNVTFNSDNHLYETSTQVSGTEIATIGALTLAAMQDINAQAAYANAGGALTVTAGRDLNLTAAQEESSIDQAIYTTSKGFMASYTSRSQRNNDSTTNIGSTLSGDSVKIQVGNDLNILGSNVVGTNDVTLTAANDIKIAASEDHDQRYFKSIETKSGLMTGNNSISVGTQRKGLEQTEVSVTHNLSTIGSQTGNVSIQAGRDVGLIGTQLQADKNVSISGRNVDIKAVVDTLDTRTLTYTETSGIRLGAKSNVTDAAMALRAATSRGQEVNDPRLKALYAAKAGYALKDLAQIIETAQKSQSGSGGLSGRVSIGIGATREESLSVTHVDTVQKSQVAAGGDLNIIARGDATPDQGDVRIKGSTLTGDNISIDAKRDLVTESQEAISKTEDSYRRLDAEVGLYAGGTMGGNGGAKGGLGIYGSIDYRQSSTELTNVTHVETTIDANKALTITTGRDATLTGTIASADQIKAAIGRNLTLTSEQDTDRYRQQQLSGQLEGRYAFGNDSGVSGSVSYSNTSSDYKSVQEQTGLNAGQGGFDISVGNHTQLNGAKIDSQASADKNQLTTNTLGHTDLKNEASYNAVSASVSFGNGSGGMGGGAMPSLNPLDSLLPGVGVPTSDSQDSTTKSAVAAGSIVVKSDQTTGQDSTKDLSRDTANANQALDRIFDAKKVAEQQELGRVLGEVGNRAIGDLSEKLGYKDGDPEKIALHAVLGALQAGLAGGSPIAGAAAGAASEWVGTQVAEYLANRDELQPTGDDAEDRKRANQVKAIEQWAALLSGAAVGGVVGGSGNSALASSATALDAERYNRQLHETEYARAKRYAKQAAQWLSKMENRQVLPEEAEARIVRQMERNVDFQTAQDDNLRTDQNIVSFMGDKLPKSDQYYYDSTYNSQYIKTNQAAYDAALAQANSGLTPDQINQRNNAAGAQIAQAGVLALSGYILAPAIGAFSLEIAAFVRNPVAYCASNPGSCIAAVDTVAGTAAGVPNTGTPIPHTIPGNGAADKMLPDADFAGRIPVRSNLVDHLMEATVSGKQISGGHNESNFMTALNNVKGTVVSTKEIAPGIREIEYRLPDKNYPNGFPTKTVYDPMVYSDTKMADMAQEAAARGMIQYQVTREPTQYVTVNGVKFEVPIKVIAGKPAEIRTVFPSKGK